MTKLWPAGLQTRIKAKYKQRAHETSLKMEIFFLEVEDEIGVGLKWSPALPFIRAAVVIQYQVDNTLE